MIFNEAFFFASANFYRAKPFQSGCMVPQLFCSSVTSASSALLSHYSLLPHKFRLPEFLYRSLYNIWRSGGWGMFVCVGDINDANLLNNSWKPAKPAIQNAGPKDRSLLGVWPTTREKKSATTYLQLIMKCEGYNRKWNQSMKIWNAEPGLSCKSFL